MNASRPSLRSWILLCLVNIMWAAQYPAYKIASEHMSVAALNLWTFVIGTLCLAPFLWRERRAAAPAPSRAASRKGWLAFVWLAAFGLIPPSVLLAWGIAHATAANGAILALSIPVLMTLMGAVLLNERPAPFYLVSLALALAGTVLISRNDFAGASFSASTLAGNGAILAGAAGSSFYNTYGKKVMQSFSELEVLVYGYLVAILLCAVISVLFDPQPFYQAAGVPTSAWIGVLVLGAVSWGIAMVLWMWILNRLAVAQVSVSVYMLPVFGVLISAFVIGERLTLTQAAGGGVVLLAAYLSTRTGREFELRFR